MEERDLSDEGTAIAYQFRWENKNFRLIGKTMSATPRGTITSTQGEELPAVAVIGVIGALDDSPTEERMSA